MACPGTEVRDVNVVLYHANCRDGLGAAFAVWKWHRPNTTHIEYIPVSYGKDKFRELLPSLLGKHVLMLDITFPLDQTKQIMEVASSFLVCDHHRSAKADLAPIPENNKIFDMNHSAAYLAWMWAFPEASVPLVIQYIEDRDIWVKKLPGTEEFTAGFFARPGTFEEIDRLMDEEEVSKCIEEGKYFLQHTEILVNQDIEHSKFVVHNIRGIPTLVGYAQSRFASDAAHQLLKSYPLLDFAVIIKHKVFGVGRGNTSYSLRSAKGKTDVSLIAKMIKYEGKTGGGHAEASGAAVEFLTPGLPFPVIKRIKKEELDELKIYSLVSEWWLSVRWKIFEWFGW
jgi:hypothetical protein